MPGTATVPRSASCGTAPYEVREVDMDTSTDEQSAPRSAAPHSPPPASRGLGAELRESLVLLGCAVVVTVGLTTAAQAALTALG